MRNIMKYLVTVFCLLGLLMNTMMVRSASSFTIRDYQIHIQVDKSAVMQVEEIMQIEDCEQLTFTKEILQNYLFDGDMDGVNETYAYEISDIQAEGATFTTEQENGKHRLHMTISEPNAQVILRYQVRMRRFEMEDANLFLYQMIAPSYDATIQHIDASITFPNTPSTAFDVYKIDHELNQSNRYQGYVNDKTLQITINEELQPNEGIMIQARLRNFFFNYSNPITLHLFFTIFSIIIVMGTYYFIIRGKRIGKKQIYRERFPLQDVPRGSYGYILDGVVDDTDIITILIEWANDNYIQIRNEHQTVSLVLVNELPLDAPIYEKDLFNLLFTNYTMVTIDQLKTRNLYRQMKHLEQDIQTTLERSKERTIYANTSYLAQLPAAFLICIPPALMMFACMYSLAYDIIGSLPHAFITAGIVYVNLLPWIWIGKHRYRLHKSVYDVYRILISLINFVCGALIYHYLLTHQTPVVYIAINYVLTVLFACILIVMERRTVYGRNQRMRLLSLRQFIRNVKSDQLTRYLSEDPYYFEKLLPYAYLFDITDIWGKKFTSIPLQAPVWYFHAKADMQSTIYWMRSLEEALESIRQSLYQSQKVQKKANSSERKKTKR